MGQVGIKMAGLQNQIKVHMADVRHTGLPEKSFDVIMCNRVLHHMPEPMPLWNEIKRLAKPGALVLLRDLIRPESEEAAHSIVQSDAAGQSEILQKGWFVSLLAAFEFDEVEKQLDAAGLSSLQTRRLGDRYFDVFGRV
jgi:SAM-dependent methyltransferase